jgi:hypothetical protein
LLLIGLRPAGHTESANQYDDDYCEYERREQVPDFHEIEARLWMFRVQALACPPTVEEQAKA